jgi:hypothetical protein
MPRTSKRSHPAENAPFAPALGFVARAHFRPRVSEDLFLPAEEVTDPGFL